jgi:hypothetical protein
MLFVLILKLPEVVQYRFLGDGWQNSPPLYSHLSKLDQPNPLCCQQHHDVRRSVLRLNGFMMPPREALMTSL